MGFSGYHRSTAFYIPFAQGKTATLSRELRQAVLIKRTWDMPDTAPFGVITIAQGEELSPQIQEP